MDQRTLRHLTPAAVMGFLSFLAAGCGGGGDDPVDQGQVVDEGPLDEGTEDMGTPRTA
jgi:hypothetical protein